MQRPKTEDINPTSEGIANPTQMAGALKRLPSI
jgi:hypothetical protein